MTAPRYGRDAAADRREELAQHWLTPEELSTMLFGSPTDPGAELARLRGEGRLFGVWQAPERRYRYPRWQLTACGHLRGEVAELLALLPRGNGSGWSQAEWLYAPHPRLGGRRPCDTFREQPLRVIEAARRQFHSHPDAKW